MYLILMELISLLGRLYSLKKEHCLLWFTMIFNSNFKILHLIRICQLNGQLPVFLFSYKVCYFLILKELKEIEVTKFENHTYNFFEEKNSLIYLIEEFK